MGFRWDVYFFGGGCVFVWFFLGEGFLVCFLGGSLYAFGGCLCVVFWGGACCMFYFFGGGIVCILRGVFLGVWSDGMFWGVVFVWGVSDLQAGLLADGRRAAAAAAAL